MTEDCTLIACPTPKNPVQDFSNQYTLDGQVVGNEPVAVVVGGVTVVVPPGTVTVPFPASPPSSLTIQSCSGPITLPVPAGSTQSQIEQIAQQLANMGAAALAQCNGPPPSAFPPGVSPFLNAQQTLDSGCTDALPLTLTVGLPAGITQNGNSLVCRAGIFASTVSQADADAQALAFLNSLMTSLFATMGATCGSTDCLASDTTNLSVTTAPFILPANGSLATVNVSVPNSALFTINAGGFPQYAIIKPSYDKTFATFYVTAIPNGNTITITVPSNIDISQMPDGTLVGVGAKIWKTLKTTEVTNPPAFTRARIVSYSTVQSQFVTCPISCVPFGGAPTWDGTMPFPTIGPGDVTYGQGSVEGGVDQNVKGSGSNLMIVFNYGSDNNGPTWQLDIECGSTLGTAGFILAWKWGGLTADGVYYVSKHDPASGPCDMAQNLKCFKIETY